MKSTPIIYSAPMVLARLAGRKTNTRRLVKPQPDVSIDALHGGKFRERAPYVLRCPETDAAYGYGFKDENRVWKCPYGQPGDELWTRETFTITRADYDLRYAGGRDRIFLIGRYLADDTAFDITLTREETAKFEKWQRQEGTFPAIYMFRSLCRDVATITAITAEQVKAISHADAKAEGIAQVGNLGLYQDYSGAGFELDSRSSYMTLWDRINAKRAPWETNPWVWSIHTTPHA